MSLIGTEVAMTPLLTDVSLLPLVNIWNSLTALSYYNWQISIFVRAVTFSRWCSNHLSLNISSTPIFSNYDVITQTRKLFFSAPYILWNNTLSNALCQAHWIQAVTRWCKADGEFWITQCSRTSLSVNTLLTLWHVICMLVIWFSWVYNMNGTNINVYGRELASHCYSGTCSQPQRSNICQSTCNVSAVVGTFSIVVLEG